MQPTALQSSTAMLPPDLPSIPIFNFDAVREQLGISPSRLASAHGSAHRDAGATSRPSPRHTTPATQESVAHGIVRPSGGSSLPRAQAAASPSVPAAAAVVPPPSAPAPSSEPAVMADPEPQPHPRAPPGQTPVPHGPPQRRGQGRPPGSKPVNRTPGKKLGRPFGRRTGPEQERPRPRAETQAGPPVRVGESSRLRVPPPARNSDPPLSESRRRRTP